MPDKDPHQSLLDRALEQFKLAAEAEEDTRRKAKEDFEFAMGNQWDPEIEEERKKDRRPCQTINRIPKFLGQVVNEQRQQRAAIQVNPVGDGADPDTAEVIQGACRHIEINSDAEIAYDMGFEHMCTGGWGLWRVTTDYIDDTSFDQEIFIKPIINPFTGYDDPYSTAMDGSDRNFFFITDDPSPETYKAQYPKSKLAGMGSDELASIGDLNPEWQSDKHTRVAEYFFIEETNYELEINGRKRTVTKRQVKWAKINAVEVLEGPQDWAGKYIPIVKVKGQEVRIDGKLYLAGLVRHAKEPQRAYNYWTSCATEKIALAPKNPYIAVAGQIEEFKAIWEQANTRNFAVLPYNAVTVAGTAAPAPARNPYEPNITAHIELIRQADQDLKSTFGIYDPSLGEAGPEQSGKAILARQKQSNISNFNFSDNMARAVRHTGRILVDLIPKIYDTARLQRIIKPDQTVDHVRIVNSRAPAMPQAPEAAQLPAQ